MSTSEPWRLFIGVPVEAGETLRSVLRDLSRMGDAVRPVAAENLHITLKFLGDTPQERVAEIASALSAMVPPGLAWTFPLRGLGAFPSPHRPSVVWAGLTDAAPLVRLATELEQALEPLGFEPETRPFQPHLTLARVKARPPQSLGELLRRHHDTAFGPLEIRQVRLYRSMLTPRGPQYSVVASAPPS